MKTAFLAAVFTALLAPVVYAKPPQPSASSLSVTYRTLKRSKAKQYEVVVKYPVFAGSSPVIRLANRTLRAYAEKEVADFVKESEADGKSQGADTAAGSYSLDITPQISLARPDLISLYFEYGVYMGGAHPNADYPAMTFGIKNGEAKRLELRDLFRSGFNPYGKLDTYIVPQLRKAGASRITEGELKTMTKDQLSSWVITKKGLEFNFAPYVVASYAEGAFNATVSFAQLKSHLDKQGPLRPFL